ncbi:uncharacterized protein LOC106756765 isoform X4 [Vigna radiata var. radiata]|nr:uncharacterized protein LOC106756765 isoform X4 [Vigna radiata var. radiata]
MDLVFTEGRRIHAGRVEPPDAKLIVIFLNLFGDVQSIKRVEDMHAKLFLPHRSMSELKKRHVEDFLSSDKVKTSRTYSAQSPAQSMIGAYPNAQNQWTNYGVQPETWPSVTQAQGQQWTAGYVRLLTGLMLDMAAIMQILNCLQQFHLVLHTGPILFLIVS